MNRYSRYTFKAKIKDNGEWVYGDLIQNPNTTGKCLIITRGVTSYSSTNEAIKEYLSESYIEVIPETLCQCTGLQDRDCKYIFENDIVEYIYEVNNSPFKANEQGVISYESTGFYYETIKGTQKYGSRAGWLVSIPNDNGKLFKIIGNKFDKEED